MTLKLFNWILSILITLVSYIINILMSLLPISYQPNLLEATSVLNNFWDHVFSFFGWVCNALLIDSTALNLIIDIFILRYVAKPTITLVKIAINWIWGAKDK